MTQPAQPTTVIGHFSVTGSGFTRIARDFMLSELPAKAWRLVSKGLRDNEGRRSADFVTDLLDGTVKLVGNESRMRPMPDKSKAATSYIKTLRYIYAGRIRIDRAWYRPKAVVTAFGPDDAHYAAKELIRGGEVSSIAEGYERIARFAIRRVEAYCHGGERVVEVGAQRPSKRLLIFEPCGEPPFWWDELPSYEAALAQFTEVGRRLEERHHDLTTPDPEQTDEERDAEIDDHEARALRDAREDRENAEADRTERARKDALRARILAQAAGDMMDLHLRDGTLVASVPRAPFLCWALSRTSIRHLAPSWECVSRSGEKLQLDDPYHTDWFYGATIHIRASETLSEDEREERTAWLGTRADDPYHYDYHDGPLNTAAYHEMGVVQEAMGQFDATVIVDGGFEVDGVVGGEIIVVPDLSPDHVDKIKYARAIITETGGRVAHLAQLATERGNITVVRVSDACTRYPVGTRLRLVPAEGKIHTTVGRS